MPANTTPEQSPIITVAARKNAEHQANAAREIDALIATLTQARADIMGDNSADWWVNGVDTSKANAAIVRVVESDAALADLRKVCAYMAKNA